MAEVAEKTIQEILMMDINIAVDRIRITMKDPDTVSKEG
jgi:hypothetical protein